MVLYHWISPAGTAGTGGWCTSVERLPVVPTPNVLDAQCYVFVTGLDVSVKGYLVYRLVMQNLSIDTCVK